MSRLEPYYEKMHPAEIPPIHRNDVHVILDNLRSAFNVGSIFRTADAGAVAHMHLTGMTAHPPHKKLEKTALGAFAYVPWTYHERTTRAIDTLHDQGMPVVAIEVTPDAKPHHGFAWPQPVGIVLGNEVTGINEKILGRCDHVVQIPMGGHKNTINVATAFGIVLFEILRQWGALDARPDQSAAQ